MSKYSESMKKALNSACGCASTMISLHTEGQDEDEFNEDCPDYTYEEYSKACDIIAKRIETMSKKYKSI